MRHAMLQGLTPLITHSSKFYSSGFTTLMLAYAQFQFRLIMGTIINYGTPHTFHDQHCSSTCHYNSHTHVLKGPCHDAIHYLPIRPAHCTHIQPHFLTGNNFHMHPRVSQLYSNSIQRQGMHKRPATIHPINHISRLTMSRQTSVCSRDCRNLTQIFAVSSYHVP